MQRRYDIPSLLSIILCLITLTESRAMFAPYLIAAVFAIWCLGKNDPGIKCHKFVPTISFICAVFITLANYGIWLHPAMPDVRTPMFVRICKLLLILIIMSGTYAVVSNILRYITVNKEKLVLAAPSGSKRSGTRSFLIPFAVIAIVYLTIYFCCYYPGLLSLDSIDQVSQIFSGIYSNHQPFYHTMLIGAFLRPGLLLFGDINAAVAFYVVVQIIFMAATFAFVIHNMINLNLPAWTAIAATACYAVLPYHIMYSFTVWKDVYFGAAVTLLIIFWIRISNGIGNKIFAYAGFSLSGIVMCIIRSNGLFAYIFVLIAVVLLMRKRRDVIFIMAATVIVAFILKHPVLNALGVTPPDTVESLSIPLQQVSRAVADGGSISEEDQELLSRILDYDALADTYDPDISDPVKNMIRDFGNEEYLSGNLGSYGMLYLRTFLKNPVSYVTAWVDSTCGYWNSGYGYWVWYWDVEDNPHGIAVSVASPGVHRFMDEYLWLYYNNNILETFTAIGLFVWTTLALLALCIAKDDRCGIIAIVPILAVLLSLLVSSPVYCEFRYMYALFCALPILFAKSVSCGRQMEDPNEDNV